SRRRGLQRLAQPRGPAARRVARSARGARRPLGAPRAQLPERVPAAAPGPHLREGPRRRARPGASRPRLAAAVGPRRALGPADARLSAVKAEFLPGNRLALLRSGEQYFPALEAAIDAAQREVFLE